MTRISDVASRRQSRASSFEPEIEKRLIAVCARHFTSSGRVTSFRVFSRNSKLIRSDIYSFVFTFLVLILFQFIRGRQVLYSHRAKYFGFHRKRLYVKDDIFLIHSKKKKIRATQKRNPLTVFTDKCG